eukprot:g27509.t1
MGGEAELELAAATQDWIEQAKGISYTECNHSFVATTASPWGQVISFFECAKCCRRTPVGKSEAQTVNLDCCGWVSYLSALLRRGRLLPIDQLLRNDDASSQRPVTGASSSSAVTFDKQNLLNIRIIPASSQTEVKVYTVTKIA